ncbi:aromatic-ring-hydroxylating dioxygenase subunit beta [Streptomyces mirabilis]|uniref:aromatic-ring-hydroxylating dioxygenase subunit beta n=1 Tax=Streptomyces mirabilis TaxID=68239 RepID=UPI0036BBD84D
MATTSTSSSWNIGAAVATHRPGDDPAAAPVSAAASLADPTARAALDGVVLFDAEQQNALEQFYYAEAALLDQHRFSTWVELFTDDCHYWMPIRQTRLTGQLDAEFTKPGEIAFYDDTKDVLTIRAHKLESAYAWGENPPSRTRHSFTNIRPLAVDGDELQVGMNFTFFRGSYDRDEDWWVGRREDVLRRVDGKFRIARRSIFLDQTVILSRNMSHLF